MESCKGLIKKKRILLIYGQYSGESIEKISSLTDKKIFQNYVNCVGLQENTNFILHVYNTYLCACVYQYFRIFTCMKNIGDTVCFH